MAAIDRRALGRRIRELRELRQFTQGELSQRAALDRSYLSQIENAKREPSLDILERLAGALGVTVATLIAPSGGSLVGEIGEDEAVWLALIRDAPEEDRELAKQVLARIRRRRQG